MANSKSARTLSKPPPPPAIPLPPIPTQLLVPEVPPVSHNPPSPSGGQQKQQQPFPPPPQTPKRSLSLAAEIPKSDPMCLRSSGDTPDAVRAPLLSRTSQSIRRAFSARRAQAPANTRRPVTTGQIGTPVLHQGEKTMQALARMGVTLDANGKGTVIAKVPLGPAQPKRSHERPRRKPVPNRDKSNGGGERGREAQEKKKRDKRRGLVFEPALEDGTTVEPLETVIAPLRVLDNVLEEGEDNERGHMESVMEGGDREVSHMSNREDSPRISSARAIERQRKLEEEVKMEQLREIERGAERELERGGRGRGERRRREHQREMERERGRSKTEEHLGREIARKPETTKEEKVIKNSEDREGQVQLEKDLERGLRLQEAKEKTRHPRHAAGGTSQSQISPVMEEESLEDISYPDCICKFLLTRDKGLASLIQREKKALLESLGATTPPAQTAVTKSHQKLSTPVRRRCSIIRVASGPERKVRMANSAQRKPPFPRQSHPSRRSLHPSIERAPSLSSSASESEPEFANGHWSKDPISDTIGGPHEEWGAPGPAYSSNRMSFAFTKDEIIRLSKVLEGEDHLKIVGREESDSIVEKLLDLGEDEIDYRRDTTIGLYDLYDR